MSIYSLLLYAFLICTSSIGVSGNSHLNALSKRQPYHVEAHFEQGSYLHSYDFNRIIQEAWHRYVSHQPVYHPLSGFYLLQDMIRTIVPNVLVHFECRSSFCMTNADADKVLEHVIRQIPRGQQTLNAIHWTVKLDSRPQSPLIARGVAVGNPSQSIASVNYAQGLGIYRLVDLSRAFEAAAKSLEDPWQELKRVDSHWHFSIVVQPNLPLIALRIEYQPQPPGARQWLLKRNFRLALLEAARKIKDDSQHGRGPRVGSASGFGCTVLQSRMDASSPGAPGVIKIARIEAAQLVTGIDRSSGRTNVTVNA